MNNLPPESIAYIISRLLERGAEAVEESEADPTSDFEAGRRMAYYEMLDTLKSELMVRDQDLKELGLDIDLINKIA